MKHIKTLLAMLCIALMAVSCSNEMDGDANTITDAAQLIKIGNFPTFDEGTQTRAIGTEDAGKTTWADGDKVLLKIQLKDTDGDDVGTATTHTLTYNSDESKWTANPALDITLKDYRNTADITAYYAPNYEWQTGEDSPKLIEGKQAGTDEYLICKKDGVKLTEVITIDFSGKRTYSRLRVAAIPGMSVVLTADEFTAAGTTTALGTEGTTATADSKGNAYFYGTWTGNTQFSLKAGWYEFTKTATASEAGKSYAVNGVKPVKVGDIYFADGSWGTQEERTGQTPIAVVYYTGDPTNDDPTLKRDHPGCTHGLAVALNDYSETTGYWQSNANGYNNTVENWIEKNKENQYVSIVVADPENDVKLNKILGYNNTKAIEDFNAADENSAWKVNVVENVKDYRKTVIAPSTSSDWYVPSPKDFHLIATAGKYNLDVYNDYYDVLDIQKINDVLTTISGAKKIQLDDSTHEYLCSAEIDKLKCTVILGCEVSYARQKNSLHFSRFTLAF